MSHDCQDNVRYSLSGKSGAMRFEGFDTARWRPDDDAQPESGSRHDSPFSTSGVPRIRNLLRTRDMVRYEDDARMRSSPAAISTRLRPDAFARYRAASAA